MKIFKYINKLLAFLTGVIIISCEEPFTPNIEIEGFTNMLVVEGIITNETGPFEVKLSSTVPLDSTVSTQPVTGAFVEIYDDLGNNYNLIGQGDGFYRTPSTDLKALPDVMYTLAVTLPNGVQYESSPVELIEEPEIEKIHYSETVKTNFNSTPPQDEFWLNIYINTKGNIGETSYLKWDFEETWEINIPNKIKVADALGNISDDLAKPNDELRTCWISKQSSSIKVESTEKLDVNEIINFPIQTIAPGGNQLDIKYSILVKQYSMNQEIFNFWSTLKEYNENLGSIYDKTPGSIFGNITCCDTNKKSLGYFMVSDVKQNRIFIEKSDHSVRTYTGYEDCLYSYVRLDGYIYFGEAEETNAKLYNAAPQCIDCNTDGTNVKPPFWE